MKLADFESLPENIEFPHEPGPDPSWQESVLLGWADPTKKIGGFIRIGHQPNLGLTRSCFGVTARDGLNYTRTAEGIRLKAADRTVDTFSADSFQSATFGVRKTRWLASDEHVDLDLSVSDVHGPYDFWTMVTARSALSESMAANHLQAGGTFTGHVRVGDQRTEQVSGFTYRDHSWGPRNMTNPKTDMATGWWFVGSFGPGFSFGFGDARMRAGGTNLYAYILRDGILDRPEVEDVSVTMALDGLSNRGGSITVSSAIFGRLVFEAEGYGNVWLTMGEKHFEMAMPCTIRCGDHVGGGLVNTILNPRNGMDRPNYIASGALNNGLYHSRNGLNVPASQ